MGRKRKRGGGGERRRIKKLSKRRVDRKGKKGKARRREKWMIDRSIRSESKTKQIITKQNKRRSKGRR